MTTGQATRPLRNERRRSRQCRGQRARCYSRAVMRAANGAAPDREVAAVLREAELTGAKQAAARLQDRQL